MLALIDLPTRMLRESWTDEHSPRRKQLRTPVDLVDHDDLLERGERSHRHLEAAEVQRVLEIEVVRRVRGMISRASVVWLHSPRPGGMR